MPRRQFIADLQQTSDGDLPPGIHDVRAGEDDGQIVFYFGKELLSGSQLEPVSITAMIPDVSEYPKSHEYVIFCADDAPKRLADQLQSLPNTNGKTVYQLLDIISGSLSRAGSGTISENGVPSLADDDELLEEEEDDYEDGYMDDDAFLTGEPSDFKQTQRTLEAFTKASASARFQGTSREFRNRVRLDLQAVKHAGFRVSVFGNIMSGANAYVVVSIRISKLGLSDEAMQAWQVHPEEYLQLIIHYPGGYMAHEKVEQTRNNHVKHLSTFGMRVFCSATPNPLIQDIIGAFQVSRDQQNNADTTESQDEEVPSCGLRNTFISKPLIALLEEHLVPILRFRSSGMDWKGAEAFWHDMQDGKIGEATNAHAAAKHYEPEARIHTLPAIVNADHFASTGYGKHSFPLIAMQFLLRHFVRCVEFCLVCHRKIETKIEAIKPYVCSRPLCLFQYMAMGFGPSIEHEIQSQPWVVDLLVSFCYTSAAAQRLKELPVGLGIVVPGLPLPTQKTVKVSDYQYLAPSYKNEPKPETKPPAISKEYEISFDRDSCEVLFSDKIEGGCPVSRGQWIVIKTSGRIGGGEQELHCRVAETTYYPTIVVDTPVGSGSAIPPPLRTVASPQPARDVGMLQHSSRTTTPKWTKTVFIKYDQELDDLDHQFKCLAICRLLDVLPSVKEMQRWLDRSNVNDLRKWPERIPPASLSLLRWIIASNRACIMQVDGISASKDSDESRKAFKQERLVGMRGYVQFRFAMGAPDKEERFLTAVKETAARLKLKYPTIFAWHGSPLHNWHMIIREGLHFNTTAHGRAYGDGVYHASDASTSIGYSSHSYSNSQGKPEGWTNSALQVSSALALNELVNAPAEYTSSTPFYVIKQLDWIQTRYLLVKCDQAIPLPAEVAPEKQHPQDPSRTPRGVHGGVNGNGNIIIPASAIKSGRGKNEVRQGANKKLKGTNGDPILLDVDSDYESVESDAEDRELLRLESDVMEPTSSQSLPLVGKKPVKTSQSPDDFEAGLLDYKTLPLMPTPVYATSATTKRLMNELTSMQKTMNATLPSELGWHMDLEKIDNVYQWIVELHSFHKMEVKGKTIPLAGDMKSRDVKSVVLEIRFGHDFPFSPPYVRVVRPQFKTFAEGGGGHIVMGGAMCMELLTNSGWSGINSMESVLLQVRLAIASEPFARLHTRHLGDYGISEAADGFIRACRTHGWVEPPGFKAIAYGTGGSRRS